MYDWATDKFYRPSLKERHELFEKIFKKENTFTSIVSKEVKENEDRPLLIISSTSFSDDEDFNTMVEGLDII